MTRSGSALHPARGLFVLCMLAVAAACSGGITSKGETGANFADGASSTGGASTGGKPSSGGATATGGSGTSTGGKASAACAADSDCRAVADYCTGCDCRALGPGQTLPACTGPGVQCFADPCMGKTALCVNGSCQISKPAGQCSVSGGSCANGETCCSGLTCCAGVPVPPGNEYCSTVCPKSDRNIKQGFMSVDPDAILEGVATLPISSWSYMTEGSSVTHLGPMAQDFKARFGLGESDRTILQVDADGVALTAIQALNARVEKLAAENAALRARVDELARARTGSRR